MNDTLNRTLDETLDERSGAYAPPEVAVDLLMAKARREQRNRRLGATAGGVAAAAVVVMVAAPNLGAPRAVQPIPGGTSTGVPTSSTWTLNGGAEEAAKKAALAAERGRIAAERIAAYRWAGGLTEGPAVELRPAYEVLGGRVTVNMPGGEARMPQDVKALSDPMEAADGGRVYLGINGTWTGGGLDRPGVLLHVSRAGQVTELGRAKAIFAAQVSPDGTRVMWSADHNSPDTGPYVHDVLQVIDIRTGATTNVTAPSALGAAEPAAWLGSQVTFLESQYADPADLAAVEDRRLFTYDVDTRAWVRSPAEKYVTITSGGVGDDRTAIALVAATADSLCARPLVNGVAAAETLTCNSNLRAMVSPDGHLALMMTLRSVDPDGDEEGRQVFTIVDSRTGTALPGTSQPPFGVGITAMAWESDHSVVGIVDDPLSDQRMGFRWDVVTLRAERLPSVPSIRGGELIKPKPDTQHG